jgi:hypothetical protein
MLSRPYAAGRRPVNAPARASRRLPRAGRRETVALELARGRLNLGASVARMLKSRRIASARPDAGGAARSFGGGMQLGARARELARALLDGFKAHDLLTYSSAISFQILTAIIPFLLFVLAAAGLLHLNSVWRDHLEPEIQANVSAAVFAVISNAVNNVFTGRPLLWATVGGGLGCRGSVSARRS